ncbi:hypothetical protein TrVE_jg11428 [Triparma verrucosa]|uniref:Uncharacterized protein n=1 Tax=Triparma verrucosa TaxID=1606542 RepID=A0A9W7KRC9_9STRA|nr:hypothetical protein TrVE_jg11428 [Triparma verrucosa]
MSRPGLPPIRLNCFGDASPSTAFTYESDRGRHGEWMHLDDALKDERTSNWHKQVLEVWKSGGDRADYVTPPENR